MKTASSPYAIIHGPAVSVRKWTERGREAYSSPISRCELFVKDTKSGEHVINLSEIEFPARPGNIMLAVIDYRNTKSGILLYVENITVRSVYAPALADSLNEGWSFMDGFMWGLLAALFFVMAAVAGLMGKGVATSPWALSLIVWITAWILANVVGSWIEGKNFDKHSDPFIKEIINAANARGLSLRSADNARGPFYRV